MKTKTKTVLLLILTFILGSVTGAVVQGYWMRQSMKRFNRHMRTPEGFSHRFFEIIEPTDEQRIEIRKILKKHHEKMMQYHREFPARMDSLKKELDSVLTGEQKEKLKKARWLKRRPGRRPERDDRPDRHDHFGSMNDSLIHPPPSPPPPGPDDFM